MKPVIDLQKEIYEVGMAMIKPATSFGALKDFVNGYGAKRGMKTVIQMHGCGYGDDGPLFSSSALADNARDLRVEINNAFVWTPIAMSADEKIRFP